MCVCLQVGSQFQEKHPRHDIWSYLSYRGSSTGMSMNLIFPTDRFKKNKRENKLAFYFEYSERGISIILFQGKSETFFFGRHIRIVIFHGRPLWKQKFTTVKSLLVCSANDTSIWRRQWWFLAKIKLNWSKSSSF